MSVWIEIRCDTQIKCSGGGPGQFVSAARMDVARAAERLIADHIAAGWTRNGGNMTCPKCAADKPGGMK